jgi:uncharacterized protein DUF6882
MDTAELDQLIDEAKALAKKRNEVAQQEFGLGGYARYDLDLRSRLLRFFDANDRQAVNARTVPVGSLAPGSKSWLWSWENESIPSEASEPMLAVTHFGEKNKVAALKHTFSPCDEALAWALAAISLKLLDAQAIYRIAQTENQLFLLLFDLKRIG